MTTLTYDIATMLSENGFGDIGTDIFALPDVPPKPDVVINIVSPSTMFPDHANVTLDIENPMVSITVRSFPGGHQECEELADKVKQFLKKVAGYSVGESRFIFINHISGPDNEGADPNMRVKFRTTFHCQRTRRLLVNSIVTNTSYIWGAELVFKVVVVTNIIQTNYIYGSCDLFYGARGYAWQKPSVVASLTI